MTSTCLSAAVAAIAALALPVAATAAGKAPAPMMRCQDISVRDTHNGAVRPHTQLTPIRDGRVLTLNPATNVTARTPFRRTSGRWVTARDGRRYAVANQFVSSTGKRGGDLLVAGHTRPDGKILCTARRLVAFSADTASATADGSLPGAGYTEVAGSSTNVAGTPLVNYATRDVCINTKLHPDHAELSPTNPNPASNVWCFTGAGAGLNDPNGVERYSPAQGGMYIDSPYHRHFIVVNNATVAAAKRPNTRPDGTLIVGSAIAWRTVNKYATIAN